MHALLLTGQNQYGVVSHFIDGIRADLKCLGVDADTLCVQSEQNIRDGLPALKPITDYAFIFSFNAVGLGSLGKNYDVRDVMRTTPVYVFCVDHPIHLMDRFWGMPVTLLCVDKEHVAFARLCGLKARYFAHAVSASLATNYISTPLAQKNSRAVFPVSYIDTAYYRGLLAPYWPRLGKVISQCRSVTRFMQAIGVLPTPNRQPSLAINADVLRLCVMVDKYLRGKAREACLRHFHDASISLTVIGRNSAQYSAIASSHQYSEAMPFDALLCEMSQARYVLHQSPGFEQGLHERVVYPLALQTPVIPFDTPFVEQVITAGLVSPGQLLSDVDDKEYESIRQQGQADVMQRHTWQCRLEKLLTDTVPAAPTLSDSE